MTKRAFDMMAAGMEDAIAYMDGDKSCGRIAAPINVRAIRVATGKTREDFARTYGLALGTVRDWEQSKRMPDGPARVLLRLIEREPETIERLMAAE
jgi:putative transcriptional regulator